MNYPTTTAYQASDNELEASTDVVMLAEEIMAKIIEKGTPIFIDAELLQQITSMVVLQSVPAELCDVASQILEFVYQTDTNSQQFQSKNA